jgi:hypothetical protein
MHDAALEDLDGLPVRFVQGSVADPEAIRDCLPRIDSVVHIAALGSVPQGLRMCAGDLVHVRARPEHLGLDLFWLAFAVSESVFVWMTAFGRPDDD